LELINNASLNSFVTFGVEASCKHLYKVQDLDELMLAVQYLEDPLILGGGSNVLPMGHLDRNILKIELEGIEIREDNGKDVLVHIGAGENWHQFVLWALNQNLGGVENLSLIPGTVGASPIQNIGAYGVELESVFDSLEAVRLGSGELERFTKEECRFGYRDSIFKQEAKGKYIITQVNLRLSREPQVNLSYGALRDALDQKGISNPGIHDVSNAVIRIRQSKLPDPALIGNAGSFFKNPMISVEQFEQLRENYPSIPSFPAIDNYIKVPAGWLIEQAGWKGKNIGKAGCYEKQELVLVNLGGASGEDIWFLADQVIKSVRSIFNVDLVPEVNIW
jgi:UDP-N-acetylmuramate dehydrogenase